jgi:hypothetical protein
MSFEQSAACAILVASDYTAVQGEPEMKKAANFNVES